MCDKNEGAHRREDGRGGSPPCDPGSEKHTTLNDSINEGWETNSEDNNWDEKNKNIRRVRLEQKGRCYRAVSPQSFYIIIIRDWLSPRNVLIFHISAMFFPNKMSGI